MQIDLEIAARENKCRITYKFSLFFRQEANHVNYCIGAEITVDNQARKALHTVTFGFLVYDRGCSDCLCSLSLAHSLLYRLASSLHDLSGGDHIRAHHD